MSPYIPILGIMVLAGAFLVVSVSLSLVVGPRRYNRAKYDSYECGIDPTPAPDATLAVRDLFVACGFNSIGIQSSGGVGKVLAEWIRDRRSPIDLPAVPSTVPDAPTITSVTAGNANVSVAFSPPGSNGGSLVSGYSARCGAQSNSGGGSPLSSVRLNSQAMPSAPTTPRTYMPVRVRPFLSALPPMQAAISTVYTGRRAEQLINGATRIVASRSLGVSIVRVAMIPGIAQANDESIGMKLFP